MLDEFRPLNPRFHFDYSLFGIELEDPIHGGGVQMNQIRAKLLASHRMSPASHADGAAFFLGGIDDSLQVIYRLGTLDTADLGRVQLRLHIIEENALLSFPLLGVKKIISSQQC